MQVDQVIDGYLQLREQKETLSRRHKEEMAPFNSQLDKLGAWLQAQLLQQGLQNFKGRSGTAFLQSSTSCRVQDFDAFLAWLIDNEAWEFLEKRASKSVVQDYVEAHQEVPPGLELKTELEVHVRKS